MKETLRHSDSAPEKASDLAYDSDSNGDAIEIEGSYNSSGSLVSK